MSSARKWAVYDVTQIFSLEYLFKLFEDVKVKQKVKLAKKSPYPAFGAHQLQISALTNLCGELELQAHNMVSSVNSLPSMLVANRMEHVWTKVMTSFIELYSHRNIQSVLKNMEKEDTLSSKKNMITEGKAWEVTPNGKATRNAVLVELGIKAGLSMVFTLLKQVWSQLAWNKQLISALSQTPGLELPPSIAVPPTINLPNKILKTILDLVLGIPSLSLSNPKNLSSLSVECLKQSEEFLEWVFSPDSIVDAEGKRLALQILLSFSMQYGSLVELLKWMDKVLALLVNYSKVYPDVSHPSLSTDYCRNILEEIRTVSSNCMR